MNFKKITALCASFVLALGICANAKTLEFAMGNNLMRESVGKIDTYLLENAPYTKNDRTMVPVRIISERFGAEVGWDEEKSQVSVKKDDKDIILTLNSDIAVVNGEEIKLDVSPEEFNGRTMVPLRFISETLGMDVSYVPATAQVIITDNEPLLTIDGTNINIDHYKSYMLSRGYAGGDDALLYVNEATDYFKSVYGAGNAILAKGESYLGVDGESIASSIAQYSDYMYESGVLTSTLAQTWDYESVVASRAIDVGISASAEEIDKKYNELFVTAKHILILADETNHVEAKEIAEAVLSEARSGKDFDALITEYNEDPGMEANPNGYTFTKNQMVAEFEESAFSLEVGEISDLVETEYGYHIIKKEPLAPITAEIADTVAMLIAEDMFYTYLDEGASIAQITAHKTDAEIAELFR